MRAITAAATTFASAVLLALMSGAVLAQTTGTVNPSDAPAESPGKEDVPPGGCMPIGMTASGEMVFPIQCKAIIERERGKAVEQNPSAVEQKPAAPVIKPVETAPVPKHVQHAEPKPLERAVRRGGCQNFQSYDPESGTYTGYDGQRHSCR